MRTSTGYVQLDPAIIEQAQQMDLLIKVKDYSFVEALTGKTNHWKPPVDLLSYATLLKCSGEALMKKYDVTLTAHYEKTVAVYAETPARVFRNS